MHEEALPSEVIAGGGSPAPPWTAFAVGSGPYGTAFERGAAKPGDRRIPRSSAGAPAGTGSINPNIPIEFLREPFGPRRAPGRGGLWFLTRAVVATSSLLSVSARSVGVTLITEKGDRWFIILLPLLDVPR